MNCCGRIGKKHNRRLPKIPESIENELLTRGVTVDFPTLDVSSVMALDGTLVKYFAEAYLHDNYFKHLVGDVIMWRQKNVDTSRTYAINFDLFGRMIEYGIQSSITVYSGDLAGVGSERVLHIHPDSYRLYPYLERNND